MPTTIGGLLGPSGNPDLLRKNLLMAKKLYDDQPRRTYWQKMAGKVMSSDQLNEIVALASGLALPQIVGEYGNPPQDTMTSPGRKVYTPQKRMLQFRMSDEAFINDQYGIVKSYGTLMGGVFLHAKEIAAAIYMNGAIDPTIITTPLGATLASTAQPLQTGFDSNTFGTQQTLGIIALEDATNNMQLQQAHKNYPMPNFGPFMLEVHPRNNLLGQRMVKAGLIPQTNNNDVNAVADQISDVLSNPYFVNPEWWALHSTDANNQGRIMITRYGYKNTGITYDEDTDSWKVTSKESYLFDVVDYRGCYYSTPS